MASPLTKQAFGASRTEIEAFNLVAENELDAPAIDRDGNGKLSGWELGAHDREEAIQETGVDPFDDPDRASFRDDLIHR